MIRFLSLFSGIGGIDLGLERAGMTCVGQVERDPFCRLILEKHWPGVPRWSDIRNFRKALWENYCRVNEINPYIDLICGGFPCQDISGAGKGEGITGKRSGLWFQMFRIIREFRPQWVLVENVPRLRILGADTVLAGLESLGYTCWPIVVGAWACGAPQERNRIWIVAHSRSSSQRSDPQGFSERQSQSGDDGLAHAPSNGRTKQGRRRQSKISLSSTTGPTMADTSGKGLPTGRIGTVSKGSEKSVPSGRNGSCWPANPRERQRDWEPERVLTQQSLGRDFDGIPERLVRLNNGHALRAYGNAVVPDVVLAIGKAIAARHRGLI